MVRATVTLVAVLFTAPASVSAAEDGTFNCEPNTGFGPGPVAVYACRDPKTASPFDDCLRAGLLLPVVGPTEAYVCDPT